MAVRNANPGSIAAVVGAANGGDIILLDAGRYTTFPIKAGLTYQSVDWAEGRVLRGTTGHQGINMAVTVTVNLSISQSGVTFRGLMHDTRGTTGINALLVSANQFVAEDCGFYHRHADGSRQIGITVQGNATGFTLRRCRLSGVGQIGSRYDHALYLKNVDSWLVEDCLIYDGGEYPFHLYPYARNGVARRCVVWAGNRCVTFSGENTAFNSSVGLPAGYYVSSNNTFEGCLFSSRTGSIIESWTPDASRPVIGNIVRDSRYAPGSTNVSSRPGVVVSNMASLNPGFAAPGVGDFNRTGVWDGFGPTYLYGTTPPPPPPPPPPPSEIDKSKVYLALADAEEQLAMAHTILGDAQERLAEVKREVDAL